MNLLILLLMLLMPPPQVQHQVSLKWKASATHGVKYGVGRATKSGGPYTTIATGVNVLTYKDTSVVSKQLYYYVVAAYMPSCGNKCLSKLSNQVSAKIP